jgi:competence ComEA-like helix-hairpin-helix protein
MPNRHAATFLPPQSFSLMSLRRFSGSHARPIAYPFRRRHRLKPTTRRSIMAEKLDLNAASTIHLRGVKGLGPSRAEEIVRWRGKHGPFTSLDDLDRVPHVGDMPPQELAKVKQQFIISAAGEGETARKINVNKANAMELRQVPGIGAAHADAIVAHRREHGPIRSVNEIDELPHFRDQSTLERQNIKAALEV